MMGRGENTPSFYLSPKVDYLVYAQLIIFVHPPPLVYTICVSCPTIVLGVGEGDFLSSKIWFIVGFL